MDIGFLAVVFVSCVILVGICIVDIVVDSCVDDVGSRVLVGKYVVDVGICVLVCHCFVDIIGNSVFVIAIVDDCVVGVGSCAVEVNSNFVVIVVFGRYADDVVVRNLVVGVSICVFIVLGC